jgi:hypothetical protein
MSTVHSQPYYHIRSKIDAPVNYPLTPSSDDYQAEPIGQSFEERRQGFIDHVLRNPAPVNTKASWYELIRMATGEEGHEGVLHSALDYIDARKDCADFVHHGILRLLYQFDSERETALDLNHPPSEELLARAKQTTLNFKYFPNEPGIDSMCTWTENHYILFTSAAYLSGQLYPDEVFSNSGEMGREKMALNKPRIMRWLDMKFRGGFNEWLSHVYYDEDLTALLSLYDFSEDAEIRAKVEMVIDLLLLDMALNSYKGVFGSTHGRSYENSKKLASNEGTTDTMKLLFGMGIYSGFDNMGAAAFALSGYRMPPVLGDIAQDREKTFVNRQRAGFRVEDAAQWGLNYEDIESGMVFYQNEAYLHPMTADLTIKMFDEFNWWENEFFPEFRPYRGFLHVLRALKLSPVLARVLERDICRNMRDEPNIYTYRTSDYMLSTAQDHRAGFGGDQHHIWQATLGPDAVCFTTHPAKIEGVSPNYWAGSGLLPSAAQYKNLTIVIYDIKKIFPSLYVPIKHLYTHAWLPKDKFDEIFEQSDWIFARKDSGYLALRSMQPYFWNAENAVCSEIEFRHTEEEYDRELIAPGKKNVWLCQMGCETEDGSFTDFIEAIVDAKLRFGDLRVEFDSPGNGVVRFGWKDKMSVDGVEVPLHGYPRYDNPFTMAEYDPRQIKVATENHRLKLDWESLQREIE